MEPKLVKKSGWVTQSWRRKQQTTFTSTRWRWVVNLRLSQQTN